MPLKNTFSQHSFLKTTKYNRDGIRRSKSSNFPMWCFLEENRIEERGGGEGFVSHRSCSMTMSTSCPLVIANRTCLSRYPPSPSWKRRIKAGRKRRTEATSLDVQRRSLNRSTGLRMRYYRPLAIPTSVSTSRMTGVPIIFGSFRGPSRVSGSQFFNDSPLSTVPPSIETSVDSEERGTDVFPFLQKSFSSERRIK